MSVQVYKIFNYKYHVFKGSESSWFLFLLPMSSELWICLVLATIVVITTMAFLNKINNGLDNFSSLTQILSSLLGQGSGEIPRYIYSDSIDLLINSPVDAFLLRS